MIYDGWKNYKLGRLVKKIGSGITPKGGREVYLDRGIPLIRSQNVLWGKLSIRDVAYISLEQHNKMRNTQLEPNDVLLNITGASIGRSCVFPEMGTMANVNQHVCIIRTGENLDPVFLSGYLNSQHGQNQILSLQAGGNRQGLNFEQIRNFDILLPLLPEQRKIAEILGAWDDAIALLEKLITAKRQLKQGLMQQLLTGKKCFKEFEESEWELTSIGKIAKLTAGGTPDTNVFAYWNGDIPWMKSGDINLKRIRAVEGRITQIGLNNSSTKKIPPYSVLIALAGQGKTRGLVAINEIEVCTNQSIAAIMTAPKKLYFEYLFYNLEFRYQEIRGLSSGDGGRGGLNLKILSQIKINLPTFKEQEKIASVLSAADTEISIIEKKLAAYKQQKRGLMQQLLTGKTRVNVN